ncbi:hypothetical protein AB0J63_26740 [Streptosporangium canum]|uniref:hypothetical protein n=1 Tax=Streptosporangium canum TaxID=324952 RepID=UPI003421CEC1
MTGRPAPVIDELRDRTRRLEAERLRPERLLPPQQVSDLREVIDILARLLEKPGLPDPAPVAFLETLRFGPGDPTCLIPAAERTNPPRTLCGVDLFTTSGWSIRGRYAGPGWTCAPCAGCVQQARRDFPGLPVVGLLALSEPFAEALGVKALDRPHLVDAAVEEIA